jgi:hypothetical protein
VNGGLGGCCVSGSSTSVPSIKLNDSKNDCTLNKLSLVIMYIWGSIDRLTLDHVHALCGSACATRCDVTDCKAGSVGVQCASI